MGKESTLLCRVVMVSVITVWALLYGSASMALAGPHGAGAEKKVAILLVAFGSSKESAQVSFTNIHTKVQEAYPGIPVQWAYTSHIIREKLARQGKVLDSPEVALAKLLDNGFTHVAVQSLHTIAGSEFHDLRRTVDAFSRIGGFERIGLGYPLLSTQDDMVRATHAILSNIPGNRQQEEGVVFMGHGTHHPANAFYAALMFQVQLLDPNVIIGTVEGYPEIDIVLQMLQDRNIDTVYLQPFMSVAGDHAKNDMAGEDPDSWKSILEAAGITCIPILKGTAEFDEFVDIWVDHIGEVLDRF